MKETHIFYTPDISTKPNELPAEEAAHAVRVLRMKEGDAMTLADGKGRFYDARITLAANHHCLFEVDNVIEDRKLWHGKIHLAVAPTKNMDRIEWLVEKATEIGVDQITFLNCDNSERRVVKKERLEKIAISAMKQSHKAYLPILTDMLPFSDFIRSCKDEQKFIAHCYNPQDADSESNVKHLSGKNFLGDLLTPNTSSVVLIGPEGDFSINEVDMAVENGFSPISLGESRLRTETAALVAVHLMYLSKRMA